MEKFWELIKERQVIIVIIIGFLSFVLGSIGVVPLGTTPWQGIDFSGRIALWISGSVLIILGVYLVIRELSKDTPNSAKQPMIYSKHRITAHDHFVSAFSSGQEVILLSMMSQTTLKQIEPQLKEAQIHGTKLKVLTLDPDIPKEIIEAIRLHLNENAHNPDETVRQVRKAWEYWSYVTEKYPNVEVRKYRSIPTLQGMFVKDKYVALELLPYNTYPLERPKIIITREVDNELFSLFQDKYFKLWQDAKE